MARKMQEEYDRQANEDYLARLQVKEKKDRRAKEREDEEVARKIQEQMDKEMALMYQEQGSSPENPTQPIRSGVRRKTGQNILNYGDPSQGGYPNSHPVFDDTLGQGGFGGPGRIASRQGAETSGYRPNDRHGGGQNYGARPSPSQYQQYPSNYGGSGYQQEEDDKELQQAILESMKASGKGRAR